MKTSCLAAIYAPLILVVNGLFLSLLNKPLKSFSGHLPLGTKEAYAKEIMAADLDKLAGIIGICGFLIQTKVYLFWQSHQTVDRSRVFFEDIPILNDVYQSDFTLNYAAT